MQLDYDKIKNFEAHSGFIKPHKKVTPKRLAHPMILIADDNKQIREQFTLYFKEKPYEIRTAVDGDEAVQQYHYYAK